MNIRISHLLTETSHEREKMSIESLSPLAGYGFDYRQHINERYSGDAHLRFRPTKPGNHGPGHYGGFQSFKKAMEQDFTEDLDAYIVCECDCVLSVSHERFAELAREAASVCREHLINYVTFGSTTNSQNGYVWSNVIEDHSNYGSFFLTDHIILAHCVLFPRHSREYLLRQLSTGAWDAVDLWVNWAFRDTTRIPLNRFAACRQPVAYQHEGMSLLDGVWKGRQ